MKQPIKDLQPGSKESFRVRENKVKPWISRESWEPDWAERGNKTETWWNQLRAIERKEKDRKKAKEWEVKR